VIIDPPKPMLRKGRRLRVCAAGDRVPGVGFVVHAAARCFADLLPKGTTPFASGLRPSGGTRAVRLSINVNGTDLQAFDVKAEKRYECETFEAEDAAKAARTGSALPFSIPSGGKAKNETPRADCPASIEMDGPYMPLRTRAESPPTDHW